MTLILSGTDGLSDVDGSAATPAIRGTDTNTGIFFPAADTIAFSEGGVESMRIDSDGDVGIGTISPAFRLDVAGGAGRIIPSGGSANTPESGAGTLNVYGATSSITTRTGALRLESYSTLAANVGTGVSFSGRLNTAPSDSSYTFAKIGGYKENATSGNGAGYLAFATSTGPGDLTERVRIDSSGNFKVISGQAVIDGGLALGTSSLQGSVIFFGSSVIAAGAGTYPLKWNSSTGVVTYDTSSRLVKENIEDSPYGLAEVLQLKSRKYHRTDDQRDEIGLVADEVQTVMPEFVPLVAKSIFTKDEADTELIAGGVNYDKLTSVLVKAIQEQQAIIQTLTDRITALEAK